MRTAWEEALPTSETQLGRLDALEKLLQESDDDYTPKVMGGSALSPVPPTPSGSHPTGPWGPIVGLTAHTGLYQQPKHLESVLSAIEDPKLVQRAADPTKAAAESAMQVLDTYESGLADFGTQVQTALTCLQDIEERYHSVSSKAESLSGTCDTLFTEQRNLESRKQLLAGPMEFFDELERLGPLLGMQQGSGTGGGAAPTLEQTHHRGLSRSLSGGGAAAAMSGGHAARSLVRAQPGSEEFVEILRRIDQAIQFFTQHTQYRDSSVYLSKMTSLQARGLGLVKAQVIHVLESASKAAAAKRTFDNLETSMIYSRFRASASRVRDLVSIINDRLHMDPSYPDLLEDCKKVYTQKRYALLKPVIRQHIAEAVRTRDTSSVARTGCAALTRICQLEAQLYEACFGDHDSDEEGDGTGFSPTPLSLKNRKPSFEMYESGDLFQLLLGLCLLLHDLIRPLVIKESNLDELCQFINVVREEILVGQAPIRGDWGGALEVVLDRIAKDAQERLIYSAEKVIRVEVELFKPSPSDLAYPAKLEDYWAHKHQHQQQHVPSSVGSTARAHATPSSPTVESEPRVARSRSQVSVSSVRGGGSNAVMPVYATWYPTLHTALTLLSKIYRAVEIHVFQDMAQDALGACNDSLLLAAKALREQVGPIDADLFLVKHLLILREQLVPFDVDFAAVEKRLDFKSTRGALSRFFVETSKMFRMGSDNALYSLALDSIPTVHEDQVDSKKRLEESLKISCNSFIQHGVERLAGGIVDLLMKAGAFLPRTHHHRRDSSTAALPTLSATPSTDATVDQEAGEEASAYEQLRQQPFMQKERVEATLVDAHAHLASAAPELLHRMGLYLDFSSTTRAILFKPVRMRILAMVTQLRDILQRVFPGTEGLGTIDGMLASIRSTLGSVLEDVPMTPSSTTSTHSHTRTSPSHTHTHRRGHTQTSVRETGPVQATVMPPDDESDGLVRTGARSERADASGVV